MNNSDNETYKTRHSGVCGLKQEIRKYIRQLKASYTPDELVQMSHKLCATVIDTPQWRNASTVLLYSSLPDEVDTQDLINAAQRENKHVLLPVVVGDDIILKEFTGEYAIGPFNIKEPTGPEFSDYTKIDLAIIPGMAFDYKNNRLGRGKGYYDRLLSRIKTSLPAEKGRGEVLFGLCFPFQYIQQRNSLNDSSLGETGGIIPTESHDIKMNKIISHFVH